MTKLISAVLAIFSVSVAADDFRERETERIIRELQVHTCSLIIMKGALADVGKVFIENGHPGASVLYVAARNPKRAKALAEMGLKEGAFKLAQIIYGFALVDSEEDRWRIIRDCARK